MVEALVVAVAAAAAWFLWDSLKAREAANAAIRPACRAEGLLFLDDTVALQAIRPARGEDVTYVRIAICGRVGEPAAGRALDDGIVRTLWLTPDEVRASRARHRSALVLRCIEDHLAGVRHPLSALYADATVYAPELKTGGPGAR